MLVQSDSNKPRVTYVKDTHLIQEWLVSRILNETTKSERVRQNVFRSINLPSRIQYVD